MAPFTPSLKLGIGLWLSQEFLKFDEWVLKTALWPGLWHNAYAGLLWQSPIYSGRQSISSWHSLKKAPVRAIIGRPNQFTLPRKHNFHKSIVFPKPDNVLPWVSQAQHSIQCWISSIRLSTSTSCLSDEQKDFFQMIKGHAINFLYVRCRSPTNISASAQCGAIPTNKCLRHR
jgi:hypothetical protein